MREFHDVNGRLWRVDVNIETVRRVRDLVEVDLMGVLEGELLKRLSNDPVILCDVLYAICRPQAEAAQISSETFGEGLRGDAIAGATTALLEELSDFLWNPEARANLRRVLELSRRVNERVNEEIARRLSDERTVEQLVREILGNPPRPGEPSGGPLESSASFQAPGGSGS